MSAVAVRKPRASKAHRIDPQQTQVYSGRPVTMCSRWGDAMTERIPLDEATRDDLCRVCWPEPAR